MLVKVGLERRGVVAALAVVGALVGTAASLALPLGAVTPAPGISVVQEGGSERWIVDLGGALVAALSPESDQGGDGGEGLFLLVRPPRKPHGPRKLLHLVLLPEPRLDLLASGIDGSFDSLAAVDGGSPDGALLVAGALDRVVSLGKLTDLARRAVPEGELPPLVVESLLETAGLDLAAFEPGPLRRGVERRVVALEPGRLRIWKAGGTWDLEREATLPLAVTRTPSGLRLSSPPVTAVRSARPADTGLYLAGPEAVGSTRLRCYRIDPSAGDVAPEELWAALPGPEKVSQSWAFEIDGVPVLIVRTQAADELNLFERQRLRVLPLSADRTRAGSAPTLAVELDSKRWHETGIALGDVDGDGHDDLVAAFPEGLSGTDLVAQWWRGEGGGRFATKPQRTDLKDAPPGWQLVATPRPGLLLVGNDRLELRSFGATGRGALVDRAELAASIPALPPAALQAPSEPSKDGKTVTVRVGSDGESSKVRNVEPDAEPLGAVELDRRPGAELLALQASGNGNQRLILLRARPE